MTIFTNQSVETSFKSAKHRDGREKFQGDIELALHCGNIPEKGVLQGRQGRVFYLEGIAYTKSMWILFALLSALFAALTSILAKIGIADINSNLATAIRTIVVLVMSWAVVFITGKQSGIAQVGGKNLLFLILSGIATGLSWLCYYRALQTGEASKVIPLDKLSVVIGIVLAFIVLRETVTIKTVIGGALITAGTFVLIL
jgi:transporter family protein